MNRHSNRSLLLAVLVACAFTVARAQEDPATADTADAGTVYVIPVDGAIEDALIYVIRRGVTEAEAIEAKAVIFEIDTLGGGLLAAEKIVRLIKDLDIPTYTYVTGRAISAGALIAFATKTIYMSPGSTFGDAMPVMVSPMGAPQEMPEDLTEKQVSFTAAFARSAAEIGGHDKELAEAMVRRDNVYKIGEEILCPEGELLTLTNVEAEQINPDTGATLLSSGTVYSRDDLLDRIGHADAAVVELTVTGAERLARIIKALSIVFLGAGLLGLYIEFKTPGLGVPGALGAVSLAIFFWGHHVAGLAGAEEILIVMIGVALILVEIFVLPGFGVAGFTGIVFVCAGLLMAMVEHAPGAPWMPPIGDFRFPLTQLTGGLVVTMAGGLLLGRFLPETRFFKTFALQTSTSAADGFVSADRAPFEAGQAGVAATALRPSGAATVDHQPVDVITGGEFIDEGTPIRIVEVRGSRILVEADTGEG